MLCVRMSPHAIPSSLKVVLVDSVSSGAQEDVLRAGPRRRDLSIARELSQQLVEFVADGDMTVLPPLRIPFLASANSPPDVYISVDEIHRVPLECDSFAETRAGLEIEEKDRRPGRLASFRYVHEGPRFFGRPCIAIARRLPFWMSACRLHHFSHHFRNGVATKSFRIDEKVDHPPQQRHGIGHGRLRLSRGETTVREAANVQVREMSQIHFTKERDQVLLERRPVGGGGAALELVVGGPPAKRLLPMNASAELKADAASEPVSLFLVRSRSICAATASASARSGTTGCFHSRPSS